MDNEITEYLEGLKIAPHREVQVGTAWPKPTIFHVPASQGALCKLGDLSENYAEPQVADHIVVYSQALVLLEWYDACTDPVFLPPDFEEGVVLAFASAVGGTVSRSERGT